MSALTQLEFPVYRSYLQDKVVVFVDKPFHIEHLLNAIEQESGIVLGEIWSQLNHTATVSE